MEANPEQQVITIAQVRPDDQPGYPKDTIESFVGHSSMGLLCPPALTWILKLKMAVEGDKATRREKTKTKRTAKNDIIRQKFYICSDVPHTHTCSEMSYRITDAECIRRAKTTQLNLTGEMKKDIYIYIYGTMVATSCDLNAPRCATTVPQVRFHGSRGGVFVGHRPPRDPGDPLQD